MNKYIQSSSLRQALHCLGLLVLTLQLTSCQPAADPADLAGKQFQVTLTDPAQQEVPDNLVFTDATFEATECRQYGFTAAPYEAMAKGRAIEFSATAQSPQEGEMHWKGTVQGDDIEGTVVWKKTGQEDIVYEFKGKAG